MVAVRRSTDSSYLPGLSPEIREVEAQLENAGVTPQSLYQLLRQGPDSFEALAASKGITLPKGMNREDLVAMLIDYVTNYQQENKGAPPPHTERLATRPLGGNGQFRSGAPVQGGWGGNGGTTAPAGAGTGTGTGTGTSRTGNGGTTAPVQPAGTARDIKGAKHVPLTAAEKADVAWDRLSPRMREAAEIAKGMGLTVTSGAEGFDGDGVHTSGSNHYSGSAIDVAGDPATMAKFYDLWKGQSPKELFYDPRGAIKNGQAIAPIGGHSDHVHLALD